MSDIPHTDETTWERLDIDKSGRKKQSASSVIWHHLSLNGSGYEFSAHMFIDEYNLSRGAVWGFLSKAMKTGAVEKIAKSYYRVLDIDEYHAKDRPTKGSEKGRKYSTNQRELPFGGHEELSDICVRFAEELDDYYHHKYHDRQLSNASTQELLDELKHRLKE